MDFQPLIAAALAEDIGPGDLTSNLLIPETLQAHMVFHARQALVMAGGGVAEAVFRTVDPAIQVTLLAKEGERLSSGAALLSAHGPARALLTAERTALNLLQRACSVATLTRAYVDAVAGTKAVILDTRKTMPGLRRLDKYAVTCGGGKNHRFGLYDAVMIKDNHIGVRSRDSGVRGLVEETRKALSSLNPESCPPPPIILECDTLDQLREALAAKPDRILLDNMNIPTLKQAVALAGGKVPLEASGGISLENVRAIAETGVDYLSVGRLTHSAPAVDIGAEVAFT